MDSTLFARPLQTARGSIRLSGSSPARAFQFGLFVSVVVANLVKSIISMPSGLISCPASRPDSQTSLVARFKDVHHSLQRMLPRQGRGLFLQDGLFLLVQVFGERTDLPASGLLCPDSGLLCLEFLIIFLTTGSGREEAQPQCQADGPSARTGCFMTDSREASGGEVTLHRPDHPTTGCYHPGERLVNNKPDKQGINFALRIPSSRTGAEPAHLPTMNLTVPPAHHVWLGPGNEAGLSPCSSASSSPTFSLR